MKQTRNQLNIFNFDKTDNTAFESINSDTINVEQSFSEARQLREKINLYGINKLIPEEVLSFLTGIDISKCSDYIRMYNFSEIVKFADLLDITPTQRAKLSLLYEFCISANTDIRKDKPDMGSSSKSGEYFINLLRFEKNEKFIMGCLNAKNRLITTCTIMEGTVNEARIYLREVVRKAIGSNACSIIVSHNHPGESMNPSEADIDLTKMLINAMNIVSIKFTDHIIVAGDRYFSMAENGLL